MSRQRVLLPRPSGRGDDLSDLLEIAGYDVVRAPFIRIESAPASDLAPTLGRLAGGEYDLLVITSPATVPALVAAAAELRGSAGSADGPVLRVPASTEIVAVGGATTRILHEAGLEVGMVAEGSGAALVEALRHRRSERTRRVADETGRLTHADTDPSDTADPAPRALPAPRVLLPASSAAAPTVREGLERAGMQVDQVDAYHPRLADLPEQVERDLSAGGFDAIVLTSSMIARRAAELGVHPSTAVVVIGRPTKEAAEQVGLRVDARAEHPDAPSLARAVHLALAPSATRPVGPSAPAVPTAPRVPTAPPVPTASSAPRTAPAPAPRRSDIR